MALIGSTIRLKCEFKTFAGSYADPPEVMLRVYNGLREVVEEIMLGPEHRVDTGRYYYDYMVPYEAVWPLYIEFNGLMEGSPAVGRISLSERWV